MKIITMAVPDSPDAPTPEIGTGAILRLDSIADAGGVVTHFRVINDRDGRQAAIVPASSSAALAELYRKFPELHAGDGKLVP